MRHYLPAVVLTALVAACSGPSDADTTSVQPSGATRAAFIDFIDEQPSVDLDPSTRPEKKIDGFTDPEVDALAKDVVSLMERSIDTDLEGLEPDNAVRRVLKHQLSETRVDFQTRAAEAVGEGHWAHFIATITDSTQSEPPRVIDTAWELSTTDGTRFDGTPAPVLQVTLQAHIVHTFGEGADRRLTVSRRYVGLGTFEPLGDRSWWPSLTAGLQTWGSDGCPLVLDSILSPDPEEDYELDALQASLEEDTVIDESSKNDEYKTFISECEAERDS